MQNKQTIVTGKMKAANELRNQNNSETFTTLIHFHCETSVNGVVTADELTNKAGLPPIYDARNSSHIILTRSRFHEHYLAATQASIAL